MKFFLIFAVCLVAVRAAEKKVNLEDIERDNLRSEAKSGQEGQSEDVTKYESGSDSSAVNYRATPSTISAEEQPQEEFKYTTPTPGYDQSSAFAAPAYDQLSAFGAPAFDQAAYAARDAAYQQQVNFFPQQNYPSLQYYAGYQPEDAAQVQKLYQQYSYQPQFTQQFKYQPEIPVGNKLQGIQQKTATQKFIQAVTKAPVSSAYTNAAENIQTSSRFSIDASKNDAKTAIPKLPAQIATKTTISNYNVQPTQQPKLSYETSQPQFQYASYTPQFAGIGEQYKSLYSGLATAPQFAYTPQLTSQAYSFPQTYSGLTYNQQSPIYTHSRLAYTQPQVSYVQPQVSHASYVQPKLAYNQAYSLPAQASQSYEFAPNSAQLQSLYADLYAKYPAFANQENSLAYPQQFYNVQQQYYVPASSAVGQADGKYEAKSQESQTAAQTYAKTPSTVRTHHYALPQVQTQSYKSALTQPQSLYSSTQFAQFQPKTKSLLDSYTPSHLIAARDSEKYRERSLQSQNVASASPAPVEHAEEKKEKSA